MVIVAGSLAGAGELNVFLVILVAWAGAVDRRQHLLRHRQVGRGAHGEAALPPREGTQGLRLGRAAARGTRELHHPHRTVHPVRPHRRHVHRGLHDAACPGIASSATTSSPAGCGRPTPRCSATSAASSSRSSRGRASLLGLAIAFSVAFIDRMGQASPVEAPGRRSVRIHVTGATGFLGSELARLAPSATGRSGRGARRERRPRALRAASARRRDPHRLPPGRRRMPARSSSTDPRTSLAPRRRSEPGSSISRPTSSSTDARARRTSRRICPPRAPSTAGRRPTQRHAWPWRRPMRCSSGRR